MERKTDLEELVAHIWSYFEDAAADPDHPARTLAFGARAPSIRTVVLRELERDHRALSFHTDLRSDKVETLRENRRAAFHHWNPDRKQQFRLAGRARLHVDDEVADRIWESEPPESRAHYRKRLPPGTPVDRPRSSHPASDDVAEPEEPRQHFAVVRCTVDSLDWLHLHPEGHYRAQFEWDGDEWSGDWVVP